jgi:two-component system chemotaxis sensor kinase CheA
MSQDFLDPELFAEFIVEAREHLETIEPNLLELERNPGNLSLLNDIFRPMHSLKGASGFLGLNAINGLAHKAENILDELRKGNLAVNPEIMDVILAATDLLRTMIENLEQTGAEGSVDTTQVIARIAAQLEGGTPPAPPIPAEDPGTADFPAEEVAPPAAASAPEPEPAPQPAPPVEELPPFVAEPYHLTSIGEGHMADFLEEAREIIERLNAALVELESPGGVQTDRINDIFRYFHNLKGNSGIIGHKELNGLTHEAETLLNRVRKGEIQNQSGHGGTAFGRGRSGRGSGQPYRAHHGIDTPRNRPLVARLKKARGRCVFETPETAATRSRPLTRTESEPARRPNRNRRRKPPPRPRAIRTRPRAVMIPRTWPFSSPPSASRSSTCTWRCRGWPRTGIEGYDRRPVPGPGHHPEFLGLYGPKRAQGPC